MTPRAFSLFTNFDLYSQQPSQSKPNNEMISTPQHSSIKPPLKMPNLDQAIGWTEAETPQAVMNEHTGEKKLVCHLCNKRYSNKGNLRVHMNVPRATQVVSEGENFHEFCLILLDFCL